MVCRNAIRGSRCCSRRISSPSGLLCSSCRLLALKENAKSLEQGFGALVDGHVSGIRHTVRTIKVNLGTVVVICAEMQWLDRKSTRLNSSHTVISYAVFCLKKKKKKSNTITTTTQYILM